jgi:hypothetical protein
MNPNSWMDLLFLIVFFFIGLYGVWTGFKKFQLAQKIKITAVSKAGSVAIGLVEISGRASSDAHGPAPISGTPCVYWKITGEYLIPGRYPVWLQIHAAESDKPFYVADDTGRVRISPRDARMDISVSTYDSTSSEPIFFVENSPPVLDERVTKYIISLDSDNREPFIEHSMNQIRMTEHCIPDNGPLYVMGSAEPVSYVSGAGPKDLLEIRKGDTDNTFYINTSGERQAVKTVSSGLSFKTFGGVFLCAVTLFGITLLPGLDDHDAGFMGANIMLLVMVCVAVYAFKVIRNEMK